MISSGRPRAHRLSSVGTAGSGCAFSASTNSIGEVIGADLLESKSDQWGASRKKPEFNSSTVLGEPLRRFHFVHGSDPMPARRDHLRDLD